METASFDFLAIGSGLAGLAYALGAAEHGTVCVITKAEMAEANTRYAQGGIAAAVGTADSWEMHERDTLVAGAGLCDPKAVRHLVQNAPRAIEWLQSVGARFDVEPDGELALGREGGHSANRIVHHADKTGAEIERAVIETVRRHPNITVVEHTFVTSLLTDGGRCRGVVAQTEEAGQKHYLAKATLLATGGCGKLYQHTTNPPVATGDGIALAGAMGAEIRDMEFMQFHPTTLYHPQMRSYLISEAVRGAGATLRNHLGGRFMYDYDERLELAPRDIVARSIVAEMAKLSTWCVYLDLTHLQREAIETEFPTIYDQLLKIGLPIHRDWIPVVPAQHYSCGGVCTDLDGRTTVEGLYAAGEVARTGVHGANRLASNSLLEAIVFGQAAAAHAAGLADPEAKEPKPVESPNCIPENDAIRIRRHLQKVMTDEAGIVRTTKGLRWALGQIEDARQEYEKMPSAPFSAYGLETRNLIHAAKFVVEGALARPANVGLHFNRDLGEPGGNYEPTPSS